MAITRTARGTASSKTSGATLTISSVTVPQGHSLVVGLAYENGQLAPSSVTHAGKHLQRRVQQDNATRAIHNSMWLKGEYRLEQIGDIVATWDAAILERSMFATSYDLIQKRDGVSGREETTSTGTPATGSTGSLITAGSFVVDTWYEIVTVGTTDFTLIGAASNTVGVVFQATGVGSGTGDAREALDFAGGMAVCCFGAEGPSTDTADAAQIRDNGSLTSATIGQRAGTTGGTAPSNITVTETYLELTTQHFSRGVLGGTTTSRRWVNTMLVLEPRARALSQGVTPSDIIAAEALSAVGNDNDLYYHWNEDTGIWEVYETTTPGTLRGSRSNETGTWS